MSGYAPLFDSIATGTLYGRWPDIGVWPLLLALSDKNGVLDVTAEYLAGVTGLPIDDVLACMNRFCQPDPKSRTKTENGARLTFIDADRDWGWVIVNKGKYREKARLLGKAEREIDSGRNAERLRDRRRPPKTAANRPSDTDTDTDKKKTQEALAPIAGLDSESWNRWVAYRRESGKPLKPASIPAAQRKLASFGATQSAVVEESIANGYQGLFAPKSNGHGGKVSQWE